MGVNNLPKVVIEQWNGRQSNSRVASQRLKATFHDIDTDTDFLARMSVSVSMSWNAAFNDYTTRYKRKFDFCRSFGVLSFVVKYVSELLQENYLIFIVFGTLYRIGSDHGSKVGMRPLL